MEEKVGVMRGEGETDAERLANIPELLQVSVFELLRTYDVSSTMCFCVHL